MRLLAPARLWHSLRICNIADRKRPWGALLIVFVIQIVYGMMLIINPHQTGTLATIGYVLIASLLIGIGRAWELVGDWGTGLFASIGLLIGHHHQPQDDVPEADQSDNRGCT